MIKVLMFVLFSLFSVSSFAHLQSPTKIKEHLVYMEINRYEFTITNANNYSSSYQLMTYDLAEGNKLINENIIGVISDIRPKQKINFTIGLKAKEKTITEKVFCSQMIGSKGGFSSKICSLVVMRRLWDEF